MRGKIFPKNIYIVPGLSEVLYVERNTFASPDNVLHEELHVTLRLGLSLLTLSDISLQAKEGRCHRHLFQVLQCEAPPSVPLDGS